MVKITEEARKQQKDSFINPIHIHRRIDSETLHLPELRPLIGKTVEIIVREAVSGPAAVPGTGDWEAAAQAAKELRESDYDFDAWRKQREYDRQHAEDHLR